MCACACTHSSAIACTWSWRDNCQLTPHLPCGSWDWGSGDGPDDKYPWLLRSYLHRPQAPCGVSFLFTSLRPMFFEEFWDCFSLPPFWDKVLNNPGWSRSQKLGPKVIKYWSHRLATILGTCVTALLTWAFLPLSSCSFLVVRQRWFVVRQRWFVARVSGSHRRLSPDRRLSIISCRASSQSRFLLTHFVYNPEKTPIFFFFNFYGLGGNRKESREAAFTVFPKAVRDRI